ncbi:hypothetical protein [Micromonospora sp. NPDC049107]
MNDRELTLLTRATRIHDDEGYRCDPTYLRSCPRFAAAILQAGKEETR